MILKYQNYECALCKAKIDNLPFEIDHIIPVSLSGTNDYSNLQALCIDCHIKKTKEDGSYSKTKPLGALLSPKDKMDMIKEFIIAHKQYNYHELSFMIANDAILSTFNLSPQSLRGLINSIKGVHIDSDSISNMRRQRNVAWMLLFKKFGMKLSAISRITTDMGVYTPHNTISDGIRGLDERDKPK